MHIWQMFFFRQIKSSESSGVTYLEDSNSQKNSHIACSITKRNLNIQSIHHLFEQSHHVALGQIDWFTFELDPSLYYTLLAHPVSTLNRSHHFKGHSIKPSKLTQGPFFFYYSACENSCLIKSVKLSLMASELS